MLAIPAPGIYIFGLPEQKKYGNRSIPENSKRMTLASRGKFLGFPGIFSEFAEFWLIFSEILLEMKKTVPGFRHGVDAGRTRKRVPEPESARIRRNPAGIA